MKIFNLVQTILALVLLSSCWTTFAIAQGFPSFAIHIGSFAIGFFIAQPIYEWLSKGSPETPTDEESER